MAAKIIDFPTDDASSKEPTLYEVKATIRESDPPIWRQLLILETVDFASLHEFLAQAFDWAGYHLYQFEKDGVSYDAPQLYNETATSPGTVGTHYDATTKLVGEVLHVGDSILYTYDLGDCWEIDVKVQDAIPADDVFVPFFPVCVDGARRGPLEDSGGMGGYEDLCRVLADPTDPGYRDACEWAGYDDGADFDPEFFDILEINEAFAFEMVDAMGDEILPDDPDELKEMCKGLIVEKMIMTMSLSMSGMLDDPGSFQE